ncbi:DUF2797 domain-containing protein, partial [Streptomyces sp. 12297]
LVGRGGRGQNKPLCSAAGADGLVVDTRLLAGWVLVAADPGAATSVPVVPVAPPAAPAAEQSGLF